MAKLDRLKFANLIAYVCGRGANIDGADIKAIDDICEIDTQLIYQPTDKIAPEKLDALMKELFNPTSIIPAIKEYRSLTGASLKEAKDAVEKVRSSQFDTADNLKKRMLDSLGTTASNPHHAFYNWNVGDINSVCNFIESF
jgi:ribosomal protein L7/L12